MIAVTLIICITVVSCVGLVCGTIVAKQEPESRVSVTKLQLDLNEVSRFLNERVQDLSAQANVLRSEISELKTKANGESLKDGLKLK